MIIINSPEDSSWEFPERFIQPLCPTLGCDFEASSPFGSLASLIPDDWLDDFADGDDSLDLPCERLLDLFAASEPELPGAEAPYLTSSDVSGLDLVPDPDLLPPVEYLTNDARLEAFTADGEAVDYLISALRHLNGASRDIQGALRIWKPQTVISDLKEDYCESLLEGCEVLDRVGTELSEICTEVLAEIEASLSLEL